MTLVNATQWAKGNHPKWLRKRSSVKSLGRRGLE